MNKRELIAEISRGSDFARWETEELLDRTLNTIIDTLNKGEEVYVNGFGRFKLKYHKARRGKHPRTGKDIEIAEKATLEFVPSKKFSVTDEALAKLAKESAE